MAGLNPWGPRGPQEQLVGEQNPRLAQPSWATCVSGRAEFSELLALSNPPHCSQRNLRKAPSGLADEINFEDFLTIMAYFRPIDTAMDEDQVQLCRREKLRCGCPSPFGSRRVGRAEDTSPSPWEVSPDCSPCNRAPRAALCPPESSHDGLRGDTPSSAGGFLGTEGGFGRCENRPGF